MQPLQRLGRSVARMCMVLILILPATAFQAQVPTAVFTPAPIPLTDPELSNPMRGYYQWRGQQFVPDVSMLDAYDRFEWRTLEPQKDQYRFDAIDAKIAEAKANGQKFAFRIRTLLSGQIAVPDYLTGLLEKGYWFDDNDDGRDDTYVPDWNDPDFLSRVGKLMAQLGARYNTDPAIGWIDIGLYGRFGEWVPWTGPLDPFDGSRPEASLATKQRLIDMHISAFPNKRLTMMTEDTAALTYAMGRSKTIGIRRDSLADPYFDRVTNDSASWLAMRDRWKTAPVITEFINPGTSLPDLAAGILQAQQYHVAMIGNGNINVSWTGLSLQEQEQLRVLGKTSGYRFIPQRIVVPSPAGRSLAIRADWSNVGVTPVYEPWSVRYQLRDEKSVIWWEGSSSLNLQKLLPTRDPFTGVNRPAVITDAFRLPLSLPPGKYHLFLVVSDPSGYRAPLALAIQGDRRGYDLGVITIDPSVSDTSSPAAVTTLAQTSRTSYSVSLSWKAPGDNNTMGTAFSYDLRYSTSPINASNWASATPVLSGKPIPAIAGTIQSMAITGLNRGTTYYFALKSSDEAGNISGLSNVVSVTTLTTLAPPTELIATAANQVIRLDWQAVPGATAYTVKRSAASGGPYTTIQTGVPTTSAIDAGVVNGTRYVYVVSATNGSGQQSGNSAEAEATPQSMPPSAPMRFMFTSRGGNAQVRLSWSAPLGAVSYTVRRSTHAGGPYDFIKPGITATSYTDTGLTNGTTYYYVVSAVNAAGEGRSSAETSSTPKEPAPAKPAPPAGVSVATGNQRVTVGWTAVSGATGYQIRRSTSHRGPFTTIATDIAQTSFNDTAVVNGTTYYYVLQAVNRALTNASFSSYSTEVAATPAQSTVSTIVPVADAYVRDGSYAGTNYGGATTLEVKDGGSGFDRRSLLRFSLSNLRATSASRATLKLYVSSLPNGTPVPIKLLAVSDDSWSETGVNWNNQPASGTVLATASLTTSGWLAVDVTTWLSQQLAGDKQMSLLILDDSAANKQVVLVSREHASNGPVLEVVTP